MLGHLDSVSRFQIQRECREMAQDPPASKKKKFFFPVSIHQLNPFQFSPEVVPFPKSGHIYLCKEVVISNAGFVE